MGFTKHNKIKSSDFAIHLIYKQNQYLNGKQSCNQHLLEHAAGFPLNEKGFQFMEGN